MNAVLLAAVLSWRVLQPGVEYATAGSLHVVRIDPAVARVTAALSSASGLPSQTAAAWCHSSRLAVATNLGMFNADGVTHTGYLRHGKHVNSARWNDYRSVVALRPGAAHWLDIDEGTPTLDTYDLVVQNLRLIAGGRRNVWSQSPKRWSEAALAIDGNGRLLILFSRAPYSMRDFNALLLSLPLDIQQAMHLEGGPEASLSIHAPGLDLDLCGSYETGFMENDGNKVQWAIPNVLGVAR
ncbi:MAG TPA: phosphodiester glycosidase family protein [Thermoanaerobaculia bacterium]|nr:phosphodiester glycosidase family protein [Thermoanaerobaculia bacterium]